MILVLDHFYYFGNHIAAAFDQHPVADLHTKTINLILIVQRGPLHRRSADRHWTQSSKRREFAGAADLHEDVLDLRDSRTRSVLVSNRPARSLAGESELPPLLGGIDLDDDSIDLIWKLLALRFHLVDEIENFIEIVRTDSMRIHFESGLLQHVQRFKMAREKTVAVAQEEVCEVVHAPPGHDLRIEHANASRCRIARIRRLRKPLLFAFFVESKECFDGHDHFAAYFEVRRNACCRKFLVIDTQWNRRHGAHVDGDILAGGSVAARERAHKLAIFIGERERHAIQLQLADKIDSALARKLVNAARPVAKLL